MPQVTEQEARIIQHLKDHPMLCTFEVAADLEMTMTDADEYLNSLHKRKLVEEKYDTHEGYVWVVASKRCPICRRAVPSRDNQIYCSDPCKDAAARKRKRAQLEMDKQRVKRPKKTRERVHIPDPEVIFKNQFLLGKTA